MKTKILVSVVVAILIVLVACSKNAYNTKPTLKIKSISGNVIPLNGLLSIQIQVTDKEGDVSDTLFMKRRRINQKATKTIEATDSLALIVPDAPNSTNGIIQLDLDYNKYLTAAERPGNQNDTLVFRFMLKDKAGNVSDSVVTEPIEVIRQ